MSSTALLCNLLLDPVDQCGGILVSLVHLQEQHDTLIRILRSPLPHADTVGDLSEVRLNDRINIRRPEPHSAGIQYSVRAAKEQHLARHLVDLDEIAMGPDAREARVIRVLVLFARVVAPEEDRLVRERRGSDEFAWLAVRNGRARSALDGAVVDLEPRAYAGALTPADVDGLEGVLDAEAAGKVCSA